jgi:hypothetical protein
MAAVGPHGPLEKIGALVPATRDRKRFGHDDTAGKDCRFFQREQLAAQQHRATIPSLLESISCTKFAKILIEKQETHTLKISVVNDTVTRSEFSNEIRSQGNYILCLANLTIIAREYVFSELRRLAG